MAIGDLVGDLATAYLTPAQRAAALAKNAAKQTSFDATNTATGPVTRASQQLAPVAGLMAAGQGPVYAQPATPQPSGSLASAFSNPAQFATPPQPLAPQSLANAAPVGVVPTATSPTYPTATQQNAIDLADPGPTATPLPPPTASLEAAYRPTGIGSGAGAIAGRIGANGVPEFSNQPADLASAAGQVPVNVSAQQPSSLTSLAPGVGVSPDPSASLESLGSAANLGDGIGTFSQGRPGDSQLALTRFQRANDLRSGYQAQDRADLANYRANQGASINVVRDSSQPLTRSDLAAAQLQQQSQLGLERNAGRAQASLEDLRTGQTAANQTRSAQRLEDIVSAGTAPGATPEQQAAYQRTIDPTGEKALGRQLTQAQIGNTNATAEKARADAEKASAEANGTTPGAQDKAAKAKLDTQLAQLEIDRRKTEATNTAKTLVDQKAGSIDIAREARDLANGISRDKRFSDVVGPVNSRLPTLDGDSQDLINRANRLQSLLTLDNLKLMSGVLTDKDIDFLGRIGSGLNVTDGGIKGSVAGTKTRLADIASKLNTKIGDYDKANLSKPAAVPQVAASTPVQIASEDAYRALPPGTQYIDPQGNHRSKP